MAAKVKVLVVGLGNMGKSHASAYHRNPGFEIVGLMSRSIKTKEMPAELKGYPLFEDFDTALAATKPDAVSINSWPNSHAEYAIKAINAGAHVFMEKPIATTNEDAEAVVAGARKNNKKLVLGYILRVHPSWMKFIELGQTLGKPLVMRLNLNQQSNGPAWTWHKNLIDSLIPIVDCGVHYVDVMCQLTGAKPVRVHGIGAALWADAAKPNYGHLHVTFDDGSVGWYEAGWGPMMSEVAFFVKDVVGPKGAVSIVPGHSEGKDQLEDVSDSADIDRHTKTDAHPVPSCRGRAGQELRHGRTRSSRCEDEPEPSGTLRSRAGLLPQGDQRGPRPQRIDGRGGQQPSHRAGRRAEHQREARGRARLSGPLRRGDAADRAGRAAARPKQSESSDERTGSRSRLRSRPQGRARHRRAQRRRRRARRRDQGRQDRRRRQRRLAARRRKVEDVAGAIVAPGLIDIHTHVYHKATSLSVDPGFVARRSAITTLIDAGSAGAGNYDGFRDYVMAHSPYRILAFLNISFPGIFGFDKDVQIGEATPRSMLPVHRCVDKIEANRDRIIGVKVRIGGIVTGDLGLGALELALEAAKAVGLPLMTHIGTRRRAMPTSSTCCGRATSSPTAIVPSRTPPSARTARCSSGREARERGVLFDIAHGMGAFGYETAEAALKDGFKPDLISSDVHVIAIEGPGFDLLHTMSKLLNCGLSLPRSSACRRAARRSPSAVRDLGHLGVGATADISVLREVESDYVFADVVGAKRQGSTLLQPVAVYLGGQADGSRRAAVRDALHRRPHRSSPPSSLRRRR